MLDPHVRQPLVPGSDGTFRLRLKVPDVYGVFKYVIDYRHAGYSYINLQQVRCADAMGCSNVCWGLLLVECMAVLAMVGMFRWFDHSCPEP